MADLDALINQILNRRATVEQWMFDAASGKRSMPTPDELRQWALHLGTPGEPLNDLGKRYRIEFDGFQGTVIGHYTRLDGEPGVVMQQDGTKVVHVYRRKWLMPADGVDTSERR